ncbi:hypothetical protein LEN_3453 [Lysobacter enzymogenes]|uniref:Uncharacterized protein n=1 Tax=Lysobacter enzymogenes TaxID=69 RepID=A0AAU9AIL5_LYSEN|nr:hypothetical protein LEN_3453 [Lysobacter enzymogenes]
MSQCLSTAYVDSDEARRARAAGSGAWPRAASAVGQGASAGPAAALMRRNTPPAAIPARPYRPWAAQTPGQKTANPAQAPPYKA